MRYDCILFDLDGTLTESEEGIIRSAGYALEQMGREVPPYEELKKFIGPPLKYSFMHFYGMSDEDAELATAKYRERFSRIGWSENKVYEGIPAILKALKRAGLVESTPGSTAPKKSVLGVSLIALVVLVSCIFAVLIIKGII